MSGAQGANPKGAFTDTTYSMASDADTSATAHKVDSTEDVKGIPVKLAADSAPNPKESAGGGGPVFGGNTGGDLGITGTSFT